MSAECGFCGLLRPGIETCRRFPSAKDDGLLEDERRDRHVSGQSPIALLRPGPPATCVAPGSVHSSLVGFPGRDAGQRLQLASVREAVADPSVLSQMVVFVRVVDEPIPLPSRDERRRRFLRIVAAGERRGRTAA
jgi:hypothetical protein